MKLQDAKKLVLAMQDAIARAEAEGRDELLHDDLTMFARQDDIARVELQEAIEGARTMPSIAGLVP